MFIELIEASTKEKILFNVDDIAVVECIHISIVNNDTRTTTIKLKNNHWWPVSESYEDVKKLLGLAISPRAETIMKP